MANLVEFEQAAVMLGLSHDELAQLRSQNKIFGYRDGASWKFKESELQRFASSRGIELQDPHKNSPAEDSKLASTESPSPVDDGLDALVNVSGSKPKSDKGMKPGLEDEELSLAGKNGPDEPPDESILVSEEELGQSDPGASSTIIGRSDGGDADSDLLAGNTGPAAANVGEDSSLDVNADTVVTSEKELVDKSDEGQQTVDPVSSGHGEGSGGDLELVEDSAPSLADSGSELPLAADSSLQNPAEGSELDLSPGSDIRSSDSGSELRLVKSDSQAESAAGDTGISIDGNSDDAIINLDGGSDDDVLILDDSQVDLDAGATNLNLGGGSDFGIDLSDIDIDVSSGGSDITLNAADSGINLMSPADSGISLETPPGRLGVSDIEALELGEAEGIDIELADDVDLDLGDDLKSGDDFLLTPVDGEELDEESDSGSQVIALDAEDYEEADMLAGDVAVLGEDDGLIGAREAGAIAGGAPLAGAPSIGPAASQTNFNAFDILLLSLPVLPLAATGMMLVDLIRSIWSWNEAYSVNSAIMDTIVGMFGG